MVVIFYALVGCGWRQLQQLARSQIRIISTPELAQRDRLPATVRVPKTA